MVLAQKQRDHKSDNNLDQWIISLVVLNTKLDALFDDFMSRAVVGQYQQDAKFDHSVDHFFFVVLNTK